MIEKALLNIAYVPGFSVLNCDYPINLEVSIGDRRYVTRATVCHSIKEQKYLMDNLNDAVNRVLGKNRIYVYNPDLKKINENQNGNKEGE